jgi:hypothetical protein
LVAQGDVASEADVRAVLNAAARSLPPLAGVFHCATECPCHVASAGAGALPIRPAIVFVIVVPLFAVLVTSHVTLGAFAGTRPKISVSYSLMSSFNLPKIKYLIRHLSLEGARKCVEEMLQLEDEQSIRVRALADVESMGLARLVGAG